MRVLPTERPPSVRRRRRRARGERARADGNQGGQTRTKKRNSLGFPCRHAAHVGGHVVVGTSESAAARVRSGARLSVRSVHISSAEVVRPAYFTRRRGGSRVRSIDDGCSAYGRATNGNGESAIAYRFPTRDRRRRWLPADGRLAHDGNRTTSAVATTSSSWCSVAV